MKLRLKNAWTALPTQWTGMNENNEEVYIKYRHGDLRMFVNDQNILYMTVGDEWDGVMTNEELARYLKDYEIEFLNGDTPREIYDEGSWLKSLKKN